jgi:hypothetical protein
VLGWSSIDQKSPSKPVDIKDLLDQGGLGMFGDRYSHLIHELQVNLLCYISSKTGTRQFLIIINLQGTKIVHSTLIIEF